MSFHDDVAARLPPSSAEALVALSDEWVKEKASLFIRERLNRGEFASQGWDEAKLA